MPSGKTSHSLTESEAAGADGRDAKTRDGVPDDRTGRRGDVPGQRPCVVEPLVAGEPPRQVAGAVDPRGGADVRDDGQLARPLQRDEVGRRRWHRRQSQPVPLVQVEVGLGSRRGADEDVAAVLVRTRPAQPVVEPAGQLGVEVDARPGHGGGRVGVRPRAGEQPVGRALGREPRHGPERVVAVAVGPARHDHRRDPDPLVPRGRPAEPYRPVVPVVAVGRLAEPGQHPRLVRVEPPLPLLLPVVPPDGRHGRQHVHRRHVVVVVDEVDQPQGRTAPVHVVGPAVVGGVDRADRLELRRLLAGHLERVEAGVRRPPHADLPVAPVLGGQPAHHLGQVALLVRLVLVERVTARRPGAAQVEPAHGVPVLVAQPLVRRGVGRRQVVLAVGQRLHQARLRPWMFARVRQVQGRGELHAVRHQDPGAGLALCPHAPDCCSMIGP